MKKGKRFVSLVLAFALAAGLLFSGSTSQAKNGFVKKNGAWYYYSGSKAAKGLKKISGKYYYFSDNGAMASGYQTVKGLVYNFQKQSDGKAPAVTNGTGYYNGKSYYFSGKGKGFFSLGTTSRNQAVAKVYDGASAKGKGKKRLKKLYCYVMKMCAYLGVGQPNLNSDWITGAASDMLSRKRGNCYNYASIIGLLAKSVGLSTAVITGKCKRGASATATAHAWVLVNGKYVLDGVFEDQNYTGAGALRFFYKKYKQLKNSLQYTYTVENKVSL